MQELGSSAGINSVIDETAHVGMSSRSLTQKELDAGLEEITIALDGMAIIVNNDNPISDLNKEQLSKIFKGEIKNWLEVGGEDGEIIIISREMGSGTRTSFEDILGLVLNDGFSLVEAAYPIIANGNGSVKSNVSTKKRAIGYISVGSLDASVSTISINGVLPTAQNIRAGTYELSRPLLYLTRKSLSNDAVESYINYVLSEEGQYIVAESNYIPIFDLP